MRLARSAACTGIALRFGHGIGAYCDGKAGGRRAASSARHCTMDEKARGPVGDVLGASESAGTPCDHLMSFKTH